MWSEIFLENSEPLLDEIDGLIERLMQFRQGIADGDRALLVRLMQEGSDRKKECFKKIEENA
jgi:prephenate dehydrogenase